MDVRKRTSAKAWIIALVVVTFATGEMANADPAWTITLTNGTGHTLTFYEVNATPPPARLPSSTVADGGTVTIDPDGYNPVFAWAGGISMTGTAPNGFFLGLGLTESPPLLQYKVFHYKVPPGEAGADPSLQPIELVNEVHELTPEEALLTVDSDWNLTIGGPTGPGICCVLANCSNVSSAGACSPGTFVAGISCTSAPAPCSSASGTVGPGGGSVGTPGGAVTVTFPEDCLPTAIVISIVDAEWATRVPLIALRTDGETLAAFTFQPDDLTFCPEAQLCMSVDITDLGLTAEQRAGLVFVNQELVCVLPLPPTYAPCTSNGDCGDGGLCGSDLDIVPTPPCDFFVEEGRTIAKCCASISHFSDYGLVAPLEPSSIFTSSWILILAVLLILIILLLLFRKKICCRLPAEA